MEGIVKIDKYYGKHGNDGKYEQFASVPQLIEGYGEWVKSLFDDGFRMYLVTFKFNQIPGSSEYKWREMSKQVEYKFLSNLDQACRTAANEPIETEQLTQINRSSRFAGSKAFQEIVSEGCHRK